MCSHLARIGAWITVTSLALGPSFQQTVKYSLEQAVDPTSTGETVAAHTYDGKSEKSGGEVSTDCNNGELEKTRQIS